MCVYIYIYIYIYIYNMPLHLSFLRSILKLIEHVEIMTFSKCVKKI